MRRGHHPPSVASTGAPLVSALARSQTGWYERGMTPGPCRYVVVEGVIGVGKTTLVERLAGALAARVVLEAFEDNPFLADFYRDREAHALSTQLFFLMSRFRQQEALAQQDLFSPVTLADYLFEKDRIFADLTLAEAERAIYRQLFEVLRPRVPAPDLVIYLRAEHAVLMDRIASRGRTYEVGIDPGYIQALMDAYDAFFAGFDAAPLLIIETGQVDLRLDSPSMEALLEVIRTGELHAYISHLNPSEVPALPKLPGL